MNTNTMIDNCNRVKNIMDSLIRELSRDRVSVESYIRIPSTSIKSPYAFVGSVTNPNSIPVAIKNEDGEVYPVVLPTRIVEDMNRSILYVDEHTREARVRYFTDMLIRNRNKKFVATFVKKDGSIRSMTFVPRTEYNKLIGKETTAWGREMVKSKARLNMITVTELYVPDGVIGSHECFRPRTINLNTILDLRLAA